MVLRMFPLVSASLISLAFGLGLETCKDSSCPAWAEFVESKKEITLGKNERDKGFSQSKEKVQYYRIEVNAGASSFTKYNRYSDFDALRNTLDGLGDAADLPPFPPKLYFNTIMETLWPSALSDRWTQLEVWLQGVLSLEANCKGAWADAVFKFLDPAASVAIAKSGMSMPPEAHKICRDDIHFFGIDVDTNSERVWRRYSDFTAFYAKLEKLGGLDEQFAVPFPPKLYWNKILGTMWERTLQERRRGLEVWLVAVKTHANSASGGIWEEEVNKFLDPAGNRDTLTWDCRLGEAMKEKASDLFQNVKDTINNYMGEKEAVEEESGEKEDL